MDPASVELLHATPGRIRLRIPEIKVNPALASVLHKQLSSFQGVHRVEANPLTGSLVVHHDGAAETRDRIVRNIEAFEARLRELIAAATSSFGASGSRAWLIATALSRFAGS